VAIRASEPILHVPPVVTVTLATLALVHVVRTWVLSARADVEFLLTFSFIPARYDATTILPDGIAGSFGTKVWTFVTYAFIHADWLHLGVNSVWLLAFGTPVARRFGPVRFFLFFAVTAAAGSALHLYTHANEFVPMVGASAAISGFMAAAIRFTFVGRGPIMRSHEASAYRRPATSLLAALSDPRILIFLAVWFGLNLLFGLGSLNLAGQEQEVAWQAHIGGFLAGLLLFALFDPVPRTPAPYEESEPLDR
jgi:membrane associated rhomboid family serine protease